MRATRRALLALPALLAAGRPGRPGRTSRSAFSSASPPGGPTDFAARLLQEPLQQLWGQPVVIENRPGASQTIAAEAVAKSPADGYTLMLCTSNLTTNPAVFSRLPYDTLRDFDPIIIVYSSPTVLFTGPDQPYRTVRDVVEAAKAQAGHGRRHLRRRHQRPFATEMFMRAAGIELTHVPYAARSRRAGRDGRPVPITFATLSA